MYRFIVLLPFLLFCCSSPKFINASYTNNSDSVFSNTQTQVFIKPYKDSLSKSMSLFVAKLDTSFVKNKPNGNLNNLYADLILEFAQQLDSIPYPKYAIFNYGGLRASLPANTITKNDIFELAPFENVLCIITLYPYQIDSLIAYLSSRTGDPIAGFTILNKKIKTSPTFDSRRPFTIVTNDYMANGGDGFSLFTRAISRKFTNISLRQALQTQLSKEFKTKGKITNRNTNRYE